MQATKETSGTRWRRFPLHPFLFAAYPVVFLYAQNAQGQVSPRELILPLVVSLAATLLVEGAFWFVLRDVQRAALGASLVVILVFSFGRVQEAIDPLGVGLAEGRMLIAWGLLLLAGILALARPREGFRRATGILNVVAAFLCVINVVPIVRVELGTTQNRLATAAPVLHADPGEEPDIYYLIFDRYAADRTLRDEFAFDNSDFSRWLDDRGFYVADDSLANYPKTTHSLASSLNMTYLDDLAATVGRDSGDWDPLSDALAGFPVATSLQRLDYRYYHVGSWWPPTAFDPAADENLVFDPPTGFDDILLESTIIPPLERRLGLRDWPSFQLRQYRRVLYQFDALERISLDPAATFTFAHLTLPHPPYVFDADGSFVPPEVTAERSRDQAYLSQLEYANRRIEELVDALVAAPGLDPIIVLQSDEGPHPIRLDEDEGAFIWPEATDAELGEKLRILNAYYLPGLDDTGLYPTISPVNTFRLIFDSYFDADLPLLPDRTFVFESNAHPYRFTDVTERLRPPP